MEPRVNGTPLPCTINILMLLCSCSYGQVSVKLRNRGSDAFKHTDYGDSVIIERRISSDGGSSYKVKSSEGKFNFYLPKDKNKKQLIAGVVTVCCVCFIICLGSYTLCNNIRQVFFSNSGNA